MEIKLFHTNDIHSHFHNYVKIKSYILNQKKRYKDRMLYVDIGDHVDRAHPLTEATRGRANVNMLNETGCDIVTIGNNEGITLEHDDLKQLYNDATFEVICANLRETGAQVPYFKPYSIKEVNGVTIGFVGVTVEFTPFYHALKWEVSEAFNWVSEAINQIKESVDVIVALSHLGKYDDESLALKFPEIDIILGAHTHHHFEHGEYVNHTLIAAAGRYGDYIGEITLTFEDNELVSKTAKLIDVDLLNEVEDTTYEDGKALLNHTIMDDALPIERNLYSVTRFTQKFAQTLREFTRSDAVIIHTGLVAQSFNGGALTEFDLHKVLPHAINLVRIELSGREIKEIFEEANVHKYKDEIIRGLGFRGDVFGIFISNNIGYIESERAYYIGGEVIDDHQTYILGTLDMYTFGRIFPQFKNAKKAYLMPEFLRDIVKEHKNELLS